MYSEIGDIFRYFRSRFKTKANAQLRKVINDFDSEEDWCHTAVGRDVTGKIVSDMKLAKSLSTMSLATATVTTHSFECPSHVLSTSSTLPDRQDEIL